MLNLSITIKKMFKNIKLYIEIYKFGHIHPVELLNASTVINVYVAFV